MLKEWFRVGLSCKWSSSTATSVRSESTLSTGSVCYFGFESFERLVRGQLLSVRGGNTKVRRLQRAET